jgi:uncharacterized protein YuzE
VKLRYDTVSGALYMRIREGQIEETLELAEPGFGAYMDIDREGNVLGLEFLSLHEFAELITRSGGALEIPERVEDPASFSLNLA